MAQDPRAAMLGAQDRQHSEQIAQEPATEGQALAARHLDGRNEERRRGVVRRLRRDLCRQIREGRRVPEEGPRAAARLLRLPRRTLETLAHLEPIESTFATVRHRTIRSKGCLSNKTALAMVFKLGEAEQKSWRRLDGHNQLPKLIQGVRFTDGIEVAANPASSQSQTAAA